jgi:exosortase
VSQSSANGFAIGKNAKHLGLAALLAGSIAIWWRSLATTLELALTSDAHTYILLILPLSLALIYDEIKRRPARSRSKAWVGAILLGVALLLQSFTGWDVWHLPAGNNASVSMFALVIWWIGSVIVCFGVEVFRSLLFPLGFLFLVVPFPERVLNWITEFLQRQSAVAAGMLFHAARVPVTRDGVLLFIPGLQIEVTRECSSIRSSTMLMVITLILAHLFLRSWWRKSLLVLVAIPLSVAKNAIRIFTIAELATRVDSGYLEGRLHRNGGILFLSLALLAVLVVLWVLRKGDSQTVQESPWR